MVLGIFVVYGKLKNTLYLYDLLKKYSIDSLIKIYICLHDNECEIDKYPIISLMDLKKMYNENMVILLSEPDNKIKSIMKLRLQSVFLPKVKILDCSTLFQDEFITDKTNCIKNCYCILCNNDVEKFDSGGEKSPIFENHQIIGGGYRNNFFVLNVIVETEIVGYCGY